METRQIRMTSVPDLLSIRPLQYGFRTEGLGHSPHDIQATMPIVISYCK